MLRLSEAAIDALRAYHWPGNVRELERVMERAVALAGSDRLEIDDLPPALLGSYAEVILPSLGRRESMREWGSRYARLVLERCHNNKRRACRELGISYYTLQGHLRFPARSRRPVAGVAVSDHLVVNTEKRQSRQYLKGRDGRAPRRRLPRP
jgi:transcriptional regulator with PAS, ATPase and Fis domain